MDNLFMAFLLTIFVKLGNLQLMESSCKSSWDPDVFKHLYICCFRIGLPWHGEKISENACCSLHQVGEWTSFGANRSKKLGRRALIVKYFFSLWIWRFALLYFCILVSFWKLNLAPAGNGEQKDKGVRATWDTWKKFKNSLDFRMERKKI